MKVILKSCIFILTLYFNLLSQYNYFSGYFSGTNPNEPLKLVLTKEVVSPGSKVIRIRFSNDTYLGQNSYLKIRSKNSNSIYQIINSKTLQDWYYTSAFFNGDRVYIDFYVAYGDINVCFGIIRLLDGVGCGYIPSHSNICGGIDTRQPASSCNVGRILPGGGTAFYTDKGVFVTAGHIFTHPILIGDFPPIVEFNVPMSDEFGCLQVSEPKDQYPIDTSSIDYEYNDNSTEITVDWAIFDINGDCHPKDFCNQTPLTPIQYDPSVIQTVRVTGYGIDYPLNNQIPQDEYTLNQVCQTSVGSFLGETNYIIKHRANTEMNSSGSPIVINSSTNGLRGLIGIHTRGGCNDQGHYGNYGTSFNYPTLFNRVTNPLTVVNISQLNANNNQLIGSTIGLWRNNRFENYTIINDEPLRVKLPKDRINTFRADYNILSNQKFYVWVTSKSKKSFLIFDTFYVTRKFSINSHFNYAIDNIKILNNFENSSFNPENDYVQFKDPWLIDYPDPQYGNTKRNRGMDAPFKSRPSPFSPDYYTNYSGDIYKGVFLNQDYRVPNQPYYSVRAEPVQWIELPHTGRAYPFYFQGWSSSPDGSAEFQNANALETPVVFKQANATINANYKGSMLSNSTKALASTSQRKVVRTPNGHLHIVYESMGKLWYQKSVNNGSTWYAPKLISYPDPEIISKNPFLTFYGNTLYLVFESFDVNGGGGVIDLYSIDQNGNITNLFPYQMINIEVESHPSVAVDEENIIIVFKETSSEPLKLIRGFYKNGQWNFSDVINVSNSTDLSFNPVIISGNSSPYNTAAPDRKYFHLVWEEIEDPTRSELCYLTIEAISTNPNDISFSNFDIISRNSGYERNTMQNVVSVYDPSSFKDVLYVGWVGQRKFYPLNANDWVPDESRAVLWISSNKGIFNSYGDDVQSVSLNKCNTRWTFAWARSNNLPVQYVDSRDLRTIYNLGNLTGVDVHISNGANPEDMYAFTLNTSAAPYPINVRTIYGNIIPDEIVVTEDSREGVVNKDGGVVYYSFGDIKAGDTKVEMKDIPDGADITTLENANGYLYSKPFMVNDNTTFVYSIRYGVNDSTALKEALTSTDYIKFRVELIDANSRELLGVFDEVTYNSQNVSKYENINYEVNCSGLGERLVQLRLVIQNNVDPYYALSDKYSDAVYNMQKKKAFKSMDYRGLLSNKVYTYTLYQNYPNPFNPVTKIRFSIKETNPVKIKLYDIVGREVAVIMNEVKDAGEYEIELDVGKLGISSGVYFYQMKAGDYTSIKKMVYLK